MISMCGFGPSGTPHLGTIKEFLLAGENCILFSDDMDGLRKIPPNSNLDASSLDIPVCEIKVDGIPFSKRNELILVYQICKFQIPHTFIRSSDLYKNGTFNNLLLQIADNYNEIQKIIDNQADNSSCIFIPRHPVTGKYVYLKNNELSFIHDDKISWFEYDNELDHTVEVSQSLLNGNCKLQWKVDWAMRWNYFKVDSEMYGKDLIDSAKTAKKIARILGHVPSKLSHYELFLDGSGNKMSKSVGNGLSLDEIFKKIPVSSIHRFVTFKPRTVRQVTWENILRHCEIDFQNAIQICHLPSFDDSQFNYEEKSCLSHWKHSFVPNFKPIENVFDYEDFMNSVHDSQSCIEYVKRTSHSQEWYNDLYSCLLGQPHGPKISYLVDYFGMNTIKEKIENT